MPVLQVALDLMQLNRSIAIAHEAVEGGADWIEVGTPLIKSEGAEAIRALRREFPGHKIIADTKTMDVGSFEVEIVAKAGDVPKVNTCIMCGKCARTCPEQAITQNAKGVYMIDKKKCVGCGKCVEACPMHVMVMPQGAEHPSKCIACGICAKACPMGILAIEEK